MGLDDVGDDDVGDVGDDGDDCGFVKPSSDVCAVFSFLHHHLSDTNILQIIRSP